VAVKGLQVLAPQSTFHAAATSAAFCTSSLKMVSNPVQHKESQQQSTEHDGVAPSTKWTSSFPGQVFFYPRASGKCFIVAECTASIHVNLHGFHSASST